VHHRRFGRSRNPPNGVFLIRASGAGSSIAAHMKGLLWSDCARTVKNRPKHDAQQNPAVDRGSAARRRTYGEGSGSGGSLRLEIALGCSQKPCLLALVLNQVEGNSRVRPSLSSQPDVVWSKIYQRIVIEPARRLLLCAVLYIRSLPDQFPLSRVIWALVPVLRGCLSLT
jgi:hypothetical protein